MIINSNIAEELYKEFNLIVSKILLSFCMIKILLSFLHNWPMQLYVASTSSKNYELYNCYINLMFLYKQKKYDNFFYFVVQKIFFVVLQESQYVILNN